MTGFVNQELLLQKEYLAAENRILRTKLPARLRLSDSGAPLSPRSESAWEGEPHVADSLIRNRVAQVGQFADDAIVAPA